MMGPMKKHPKKKVSRRYFVGSEDKEFNVKSMRKYIGQKQELDKRLGELVEPILSKGSPHVLDMCCGLGHLILHLKRDFPSAVYVGVDQTPYLVEEARGLSKAVPGVSFEVGDLFKIPKRFEKKFDVTICWKTLSWLPGYEKALRCLMRTAKKHLFVSALFYEGDIDYEIKVREYAKDRGKKGRDAYYNIYSLPRFERFALQNGAKRVRSHDFKIGIDLPRGDIDHMATYTVPLRNGERMQMSGALPMPWKIVHIEL